MYLSLIYLPLLGSIVSGFFGRKVGVNGAQVITCTCVVITTILAIISFFEVGLSNTSVSISLFRWVDSESLNVLWKFNFDALTVSMLIPVLIVSSLVHIYSIGYMSHDPHNQRFFSYLSLFTFMMIVLVTANNFLLMFVGWEGVGICSYLLVNFWYTRIAANQSSISALLTNRVGDSLLTIGMFAIILAFGNLDYTTVFSLAPYINENLVTFIGICLLIGAMAKSSQVGLHVWLPLAMEGPTPVSALIHAATMVTAGVYLLMRASPLIEYSSTVLILCLWIGSITTVFSSLIGLFQQDIKKVIAYSTMSQLGMMVIAVGLSSYNVALFHLVNHAFYKGLLFLGAGAVIHAVSDNQDFRKYGGLILFLPLTYSVMLIASLSLVAFPFMTGFYSKDFILESAYGQFELSSTIVYFIATIGAMFTTLYSVKVLYLTFLSNPNGPIANYKNAHEGDLYMSLPLMVLAIFSIFFGYITKDVFIGLASVFFSDNSLFIHPLNEKMLNTEFAVPSSFKLLPLLFTLTLSILSLFVFEYLPKLLIYIKFTKWGYNIFSFFNQRFYIELLYNKYITNMFLNLGGQTTKVLDKGSVELLGPYGLEIILLKLSKSINSLNTGVITSYALYILIGLILYILIPFVSLKDTGLLLLLVLALISAIIVRKQTNNALVSSSFSYIYYLYLRCAHYLLNSNLPSILLTAVSLAYMIYFLSSLILVYYFPEVFMTFYYNYICTPMFLADLPNNQFLSGQDASNGSQSLSGQDASNGSQPLEDTSNSVDEPSSNDTANSNADNESSSSDVDDTFSQASADSAESNPPKLDTCRYEGDEDRTEAAREVASAAVEQGQGNRLHDITLNRPEEELIRIRGTLGPGPHRFVHSNPEIVAFEPNKVNADCDGCGGPKSGADPQALCRDCPVTAHIKCINPTNVTHEPSEETLSYLQEPVSSYDPTAYNSNNVTDNTNNGNGGNNHSLGINADAGEGSSKSAGVGSSRSAGEDSSNSTGNVSTHSNIDNYNDTNASSSSNVQESAEPSSSTDVQESAELSTDAQESAEPSSSTDAQESAESSSSFKGKGRANP